MKVLQKCRAAQDWGGPAKVERAILLPTIRAVSGPPDVSVTLPEHGGMLQEQPAPGFPAPHCITFPLGLLAGFWLSTSALAGGMGLLPHGVILMASQKGCGTTVAG